MQKMPIHKPRKMTCANIYLVLSNRFNNKGGISDAPKVKKRPQAQVWKKMHTWYVLSAQKKLCSCCRTGLVQLPYLPYDKIFSILEQLEKVYGQ